MESNCAAVVVLISKVFFSPFQLIKKQAEITSRQQPFFYHLGKEYHLAKEVSGGQKNEL